MKAATGQAAERDAARSAPSCTGTVPADGGRVAGAGSSASTGRAGSCGRCWSARPPPTRRKGGRFEDALRQVVVVRGTEPLPVRDPVPLHCRRTSPAGIEGGQRPA